MVLHVHVDDVSIPTGIDRPHVLAVLFDQDSTLRATQALPSVDVVGDLLVHDDFDRLSACVGDDDAHFGILSLGVPC